MPDLLHTHDLRAAYSLTDVLHGVDIAIPNGSVVAILGANGAGKTTLLRAILNVVKSRGAVEFQGKRIDALATEEIVRLGIAHVPDGRGTFTGLTVEDNLRLGAYTRKDRGAIAADTEQVFHYFPRLKERRHQLAGTLSGGEQQMLAISRALMLRPQLMLLDEPSFGLAPKVVEEIFAIFKNIRQENKVGILLVEQNAKLALEFADFAYLLETGRVVLSGSVAQMKASDAIRNSYLGYET